MFKNPRARVLILLAITVAVAFALRSHFRSSPDVDFVSDIAYEIVYGDIEALGEDFVTIRTSTEDTSQIKINENTNFNIFTRSDNSFNSEANFGDLDIGQNVEIGALESGFAAYITVNIFEEQFMSVIKSFRDNVLTLENEERGTFTKTITSETLITVFNDDGVGVEGSEDNLRPGLSVMLAFETPDSLEVIVYPVDLFKVED